MCHFFASLFEYNIQITRKNYILRKVDFDWYSSIDLHSFCTLPVSALIWNQSGTTTSSEAGSLLRVEVLPLLDILCPSLMSTIHASCV